MVDDIVTTGATLAAVSARLREADMQVTGAAVLAATTLRRARPDAVAEPPSARPTRAGGHPISTTNEG